ncbi:MAG: hypothetical protein CL549_15835 [Alcanivorax sp.]|nr:hypothetical protein [Alcanivorax sp.]MAY11929.1 hypothetical protein [Alcanivorax sp.]MBI56755.1 hypothetical protein [Alcanivorax sp.]HCE39698.1 hypothetical protein [Alcanivorax sp.]|tara:strand:+ start:32536 stop:33006 length:471 start_codon:yes stop_codon:yes gene_type:complete
MDRDERTEYEAKLDVTYAVELQRRHVQFYRHLAGICTYLTLAASAFAAMLTVKEPMLAAGLAAFVVLLNMLVVTVRPETKAAEHADLRRRWLGLQAQMDKLTLTELDKKIAHLDALDTHIIRALEMPAYNGNLRRHGFSEQCQKLSITQRLMNRLS